MAPAGEQPPGHDDHDDHDEHADHEDHDDEHGEEDAYAGEPPHRLDRVWVHPSEYAGPAPTRARRRVGWSVVVPIAAGAVGALTAIGALAAFGAFDRDATNDDGTEIEQVAAGDAALARLVDAVGNGLVLVTATDATGARRSSGVCLRHRGEILTSATTIGDATDVTVQDESGETVTATVVGRDPTTDLALIVVDQPLPAAPLATSQPDAGDSVWIVGAAASTKRGPWVSAGVLATTDALVSGEPGPRTAGLFETDALSTWRAIGGALIDRTGGVAGIIVDSPAGVAGSYAIPITRAVAIADALRADGTVAHGSLGVEGMDTPEGPMISTVPEGSEAETAGLVAGDLVVSVAGEDVVDMGELIARVRTYRPGRTITVDVMREGRPVSVKVTLSSTATEAAAVAVAG